MHRLEDRVAVVTGAASGIGRATAIALANTGCHVALVDLNESGLQELAREVEGAGRRATCHAVDVADRNAMARLVGDVVREHGRVEIVVNNAGVSVTSTFEHHSLEDFEWLIGVNFWGVIYGCKLFLPELLARDEAHIVNLSSVFGLVGMPLNSSYSASKFAVRGFSEALRAELSGTRVGVTCVHPGGVATNIVQSARVNEAGGFDGLHASTVRRFKRMLPPEKAAAKIVRGIRDNSPRVLITREAYLIDALKRLLPALSSELLGRRWRKIVARQVERGV